MTATKNSQNAPHGENRGGVTSQIFLSLGSNLNDPVSQIQRAIKTLASLVSTIECAPLYQSKPLGPQDQPDFVNTVISGYTDLSPEELLITVKGIEQQQYRVKTKHWGPRTIDIDILFYGNIQIKTPDLTIPHKELFNRPFVTIPLLDLIPDGITPTGDHTEPSVFSPMSFQRVEGNLHHSIFPMYRRRNQRQTC